MPNLSVHQLNLWLSQPKEHQRLEFKEAKHTFSFEKTCDYCVAIANEGGGHLILGVADRHPRAVVGSDAFLDTNKTAKDLRRKLSFRVDVEAIAHPNGRVVVLEIPSRPNGTAYALEGKYLMRSGDELVPMSEDRLRKIFDEGRPDWLNEASEIVLTSEDVVKTLDIQTYFDLRGIAYPSQREGVIDRLVQD